MALTTEFEKQGNWLFRWRSYLPLLLFAFIAVALKESKASFQTPFHECWELACLLISFAGLIIRVITVGHAPAKTSGRNTRHQRAAELNTTGLYSVVRHPLYLGNYLIGLGISLVLFVWWLPLIYSLLFCAYYERIMFAEEAFLHEKFGERFRSWAAKTPAVFPRRLRWRKPPLPFSFRNALRREYGGLMVIILGHTSLEFVESLIVYRRVVWEPFWAVLLFGGIAAYFTLRTLKRRTSLLNVPGR